MLIYYLDTDLKRMLEMTEVVMLGFLNGIYDSMSDTTASQVFSYIKLNFKQIIKMYDETDLFQFRTKLINQKRTIVILNMLIKLN